MISPLQTWKGRRVRSPGDDPQSAVRKVPESPRPGSLFFVPSPLEGWGVDVLIDSMPADRAVVVFETDAELDEFIGPAFAEGLGARASDRRLFRLTSDSEAAVH